MTRSSATLCVGATNVFVILLALVARSDAFIVTRGHQAAWRVDNERSQLSNAALMVFTSRNRQRKSRRRSLSTGSVPTALRNSLFRDVTGITSTSPTDDADLMNAAAAITQESCSLLGIKAVGVDYGLVRTGVAVTVGYSPQPLDILADFNTTEVSHEIIQICRAEQASRIVVGLPLHKNGTEAEQTNITRVFASELAVEVYRNLGPEFPIYMWDERYTSKAAEAMLQSKDPTRNYAGELDAEAACIILESYYKEGGVDAEKVEVPIEIKEESDLVWEERRKSAEAATQRALDDREARLRWRNEEMERDRKEQQLLQQQQQNDGTSISKKKKKKKKKKR